jgi:hypothetical protein
MVMKIWSIKNPLLGGVLLTSVFSQVAGAAELPANQPLPLPTPGIPTPDQAVRRMATNVVLDSTSAAALSSINKPTATGIGADRITPSRPISPLPLTAGLPNPSRVLSSCPANVCGLVATQPPVTLGTVLPSGISKTEQNKFADFNASIPSTASKSSVIQPQTLTPNDQITGAAKTALSTEPGLSKDIAFGQPAAKSESKLKTVNVREASREENQSDIPLTFAKVTTPEKAIGFGSVQNQITSFTGQLMANSWKLITVLPKPQLDASLLNIGNSSPFQQNDTLSFSPRLTLGTAVEPLSPTKVSSSLSASPLFTSQKPVIKPSPVLIQWNQSSVFTKPGNMGNSKLDKLPTYQGFSNLNRFETSTKPFNIMTILATLNTSTLSSNKFGIQNY